MFAEVLKDVTCCLFTCLSSLSVSDPFVSSTQSPGDRPVSAYGFRPDEQFFYNYTASSRYNSSPECDQLQELLLFFI